MTAAAATLPSRGQMVDIGGRSLRMVCAGPDRGASTNPTVLLEAGAFGFSADWAVVQGQLADLGVRSCAYDRAGLGHNTFTPEALALVVRSGEGLLRRTRNLCLGCLIEAVRDQTRIVDLKHVNRVLIQPHWRKDCDQPLTA